MSSMPQDAFILETNEGPTATESSDDENVFEMSDDSAGHARPSPSQEVTLRTVSQLTSIPRSPTLTADAAWVGA